MFKPIATAALLGIISATANAQTLGLDVQFEHVEARGAVLVAVYNAQTYEGGKPVASAKINITGDSAQTHFDLPQGEYAIKAFHDVNENGQMDVNPFGIPIEPFAFSNNAKGNMAPPKWDDAKFILTPPSATQKISF